MSTYIAACISFVLIIYLILMFVYSISVIVCVCNGDITVRVHEILLAFIGNIIAVVFLICILF